MGFSPTSEKTIHYGFRRFQLRKRIQLLRISSPLDQFLRILWNEIKEIITGQQFDLVDGHAEISPRRIYVYRSKVRHDDTECSCVLADALQVVRPVGEH